MFLIFGNNEVINMKNIVHIEARKNYEPDNNSRWYDIDSIMVKFISANYDFISFFVIKKEDWLGLLSAIRNNESIFIIEEYESDKSDKSILSKRWRIMDSVSGMISKNR